MFYGVFVRVNQVILTKSGKKKSPFLQRSDMNKILNSKALQAALTFHSQFPAVFSLLLSSCDQ